MSDEESKTHARLLMESVGYNVVDIPESDVPGEKRADLACVRGDDSLIVEAKGKSAHAEYIKMVAESRGPSGSVISRAISPWSALSSVIEKAARQLDQTSLPVASARVLAISCLHPDWKFVFDAFRRCLYGLTELALWKGTDNVPELVGTKPCYYYEHSAFRRFTIIDAVIFAGPDSSQLLVNEFGRASALFRKSTLYAHYDAGSALCEPEAQRARGNALWISSPEPLDHSARHQHLLETYGFLTNPVSENQMNGMVSISREQLEDAP